MNIEYRFKTWIKHEYKRRYNINLRFWDFLLVFTKVLKKELNTKEIKMNIKYRLIHERIVGLPVWEPRVSTVFEIK